MDQPFLYSAVTTKLHTHMMLMESLYISALVMGLLGGTHCAGMCGGIVSGLTLGISKDERNSSSTLSIYLLAYNSGRILSYIIAGIVISSIGNIADSIGSGMEVRKILTLIASSVMILLGLYLTGWWTTAIIKIEKAGAILWRFIEPFAKKFIPIRSTSQAVFAGMLWGWLPCGLVYTALLWAMSAETIAQGGIIMASFGIGTLPTLFGIGYFSNRVIIHLQKQWVRTSAGIMVAGLGLAQLQTLYF